MEPDIKKTNDFYKSTNPEELCTCDYCKNYRAKVKRAYPQVSEYLSSLGVDIEKPFHVSYLDPDKHGMIEYCVCHYIVFGICEESFHHMIGEVEFTKGRDYPDPDVKDAQHFVLEASTLVLEGWKAFPASKS